MRSAVAAVVEDGVAGTPPVLQSVGEDAFEMGAAPITLINGDTLIDLLIQHGIGLKKKAIEYFEVDEKVFQAVPEEAEVGEDQDAEGEET